MGRIEDNEKRLDDLRIIVDKLDNDLEDFYKNLKEYEVLNKYYGSKSWFRDKEDFEKGKINTKAGVLSEDAVWDLDERIRDIITRMEGIIEVFQTK